MPSTTTSPVYPFDPTGQLLSNKIVGEQQILSTANFRDYHFVVPEKGPFFAESLEIVLRNMAGEIRTLEDGVDYYATHWFIGASRACAKPIYGSISFLDLTLAGTITMGYQTVGGVWVENISKVNEIMSDRLHNPRITSWESVVDMVVSFPVIDHQWNLTDMVGMSAVVAKLQGIDDAIRSKIIGDVTLQTHMLNRNNPHVVTAAQTGAYTKAETLQLINLALDDFKTNFKGGSTDGTPEDELYFLGQQ